MHERAVFRIEARLEVNARVAGDLESLRMGEELMQARNVLTFFIVFKSAKESAFTKALISFWIVSALTVAARQSRTRANKIDARMTDANLKY
jgi:hypothetical protein